MNKKIGKIISSGNKGKGIRSDCFVSLELKNEDGIDIQFESKVKVLFGKSIIELVKEILNYFEIDNTKIIIEDSGALPFVIAARIEAAIKKLIDTDKEYLLELIPENMYDTQKNCNRFSRLYLPGNSPSLMINAGIHNPNGIILDLEDSVASEAKDQARILLCELLKTQDFGEAALVVRINGIHSDTDYWRADIEACAEAFHKDNPLIIRVPKVESPEDIQLICRELDAVEKQFELAKGADRKSVV